MSGDSVSIVDGGVMEGGGQILRTAVACAAIVNQTVRIRNIRAGRPKPGLSNQHLAGIQLCAELSRAKLSECALGSTELTFAPQTVQAGEYTADAKTAGSISLLLQVAVPVLAYASGDAANFSILNLKGGTDAKFAPPIDYMIEVTFHYFGQMGLQCSVDVLRRGFYPQGGGSVRARVESLKSPLSPLTLLDAGPIQCITGYAFVAGRVPIKVAQEIKNECLRCCSQAFASCPVQIRVFREDDHRCVGNVSAFMFVARTANGCRLAVSSLGDPRGPHHTQLVRDAVAQLSRLTTLGACCDDNMQDQVILPMALAAGHSEIRTGPLTLHTKTAIYVVELLLPVKFHTTEVEGGAIIIACDGIGQGPSTSK